MKIAIVITVKNEERILKNNLLYHNAIGVDKAFVYFDNTTDNGEETIENLDFVEINTSVGTEKYKHIPYLDKFISNSEEHHTARQCLNTYDAKCKCKDMGIDWLISLDADELIATSLEDISNLKLFFKNVKSNVDLVNFKTFEALQRQINYDNVFAKEVLFKATPSFKRRIDKVYKSFYNPGSHKQIKYSYWYGHTMGKGAIRVESNVIPHNVHRYKASDQTPINVLNSGFILHYHAYDAIDFIKKFTNFKDHPNTFLSGNNVESLKLLLIDVVNNSGYNKGELVKYFKENVMFNTSEVERLKRNKVFRFLPRKADSVIKITSVRDVFHLKINSIN